MNFQTWYVIFVLGFASGVAATFLWEKAWEIIAEAWPEIRERRKHRHNGGCT